MNGLKSHMIFLKVCFLYPQVQEQHVLNHLQLPHILVQKDVKLILPHQIYPSLHEV